MRTDQIVGKNTGWHKPEYLLHLMIILGLVSAVLVVSLTSYGLYQVYAEHIMHDAEKDAVRLSEVILTQQNDLLLFEGPSGIALSANNTEKFSARIKTFLHPFNIVKIKIFDLEGRIIVSVKLTPAYISDSVVAKLYRIQA